ncbi:hypothetical protein Tco_0385076 [Tanacetum coccineum]
MDDMTAQMCQYGKGRISYARVLIEVNACKDCKEFFEVQYRDDTGAIVRSKIMGQKSNNLRVVICLIMRKGRMIKSLFGTKMRKWNNKQEYRPKSASKTGQQADVLPDKIMGEMNVDNERHANKKPTPSETSKWTHKMVNYFKDKLNNMNDNLEIYNEGDVLEDSGQNGKCMEENEIKGNQAFNMSKCKKGCRIMIGWNPNDVQTEVLTNYGKKRCSLWNDLKIQKAFIDGFPWVMMGGFNVTLLSREHSVAPGPDGYTTCFFKNAWVMVGDEVYDDVKEFFKIDKLLKEVNATIISLIPKIPTPLQFSNFLGPLLVAMSCTNASARY